MYDLLILATSFFILIGLVVALPHLKDSLCEKLITILLLGNLATFFVFWTLGLVVPFPFPFPCFGVFIIEPILAPLLAVLSATHLKRFKKKRLIVSLMIINFALGLFSAFVLCGPPRLSA